MQESEGRKPDYLGFNRSSSNRKLWILLKIIFLKILLNIGKKEIDR